VGLIKKHSKAGKKRIRGRWHQADRGSVCPPPTTPRAGNWGGSLGPEAGHRVAAGAKRNRRPKKPAVRDSG